jgi:hypothetical protein
MPIGGAELWLPHRHPLKMAFAPDRAIPAELVELIQRQSVQKARDLTTQELRRFFASKESRDKRAWLSQAAGESAESQQQRAYLAGALLEIEKATTNEGELSRPGLPFDTFALRTGVTSVGDDLRWPAAKVFAGAGPQPTPKGMSRGLIELALGTVEHALMMMWSMKEKAWLKPPREGWVSRDMKENLLKGPGSPRAKIFRAEAELRHPPRAAHRGELQRGRLAQERRPGPGYRLRLPSSNGWRASGARTEVRGAGPRQRGLEGRRIRGLGQADAMSSYPYLGPGLRLFRGLGRLGFLFFEVVDVVPIRLEDLIPIGIGDVLFGEFVDVHLFAIADLGGSRLGLGRLEFFEDVVRVDILVVWIFHKGAGGCSCLACVNPWPLVSEI